MSRLLLILLALMTMVTPMSMDIYLPALEHITKALNTDFGTAQLTVSLFMLGFAITQLIFGSLSDHYGRRKIFYFGMSIYLIATLFCIMAINIDMLIIARFFQAAGGCVGTVTAFAVVRDLNEREKSAKLFALLGIGMALAPIIAPVIGAHLIEYFSWRSTFVFVFIIAALVLLMSMFILPETVKRKNNAFEFKQQLIRYYGLFKHPEFILYALIIVCIFNGFFAYIANSPDLLIHDLQVSVRHYGYLFALTGVALILGNTLSSKLISKLDTNMVVKIACGINLFASLLMLALNLFFGFTVWTLMVPIFFVAFSYTTLIPAALGNLLAPFHDRAGMATALVTSLRFGIAPIFASFTAFLHNYGQWPLTILLLTMSILALVLSMRQAHRASDFVAMSNQANLQNTQEGVQ